MNTLTQATPLSQKTPQQVVHTLCQLSQSLLDIAEQVSQALVQNDLLAFAVLQDEKETLSLRYQDTSETFRQRLNEFHNVNSAAINRLQDLQDKLRDASEVNNVFIKQLESNAKDFIKTGMENASTFGKSAQATFPTRKAESGDYCTHAIETNNMA